MHYKTIVLELLEQRTELYEQLRKSRQLLPIMEVLATELRDHHLALTQSMARANSDGDPYQVPAQALELAVKDLDDRLPAASPQSENEALSLDQAMAFLVSHTPRS